MAVNLVLTRLVALSQRSSIVSIWVTLWAIAITIWSTSPVAAQGPTRDGRRQFVESLLQSLIESQFDRPSPPQDQPPGPPADGKLVSARQQLDAFSSHSNQLVNHWNSDVARAPGSRPLLPDLIKLNATVSHVQRRAANARRLEDLQPDFVALDRDWRLLAYRLQHIEGLSAECARCIQQMNAADTAICGLLGVSPQVDFNDLVTEAIGVNTSLGHLIEDIEIEMPRTRLGRSLIAEASHVKQQAVALSNAVSRRQNYDAIVETFRHFYSNWRLLAAKIRQVNSRHLERNVRRIDEASHLIHELLWLTEDVDYGRLTYMAQALRRDVNELFDAVSLNQMLELPKGPLVLSIAGEFYGLCENFSDSIELRAPLGQLQAEYLYLVESWPELSECLRPCRNIQVVQSLKGVEESFASLRDVVGLASRIDLHRANELATALVAAGENANSEVQRHVFSNSRYDQRFRFDSARSSAAFHAAARRLHESILNEQMQLLGERTAAVADAWKDLNERCFRRLVAADQVHLRELQRHVTQQVVELQAMLQL